MAWPHAHLGHLDTHVKLLNGMCLLPLERGLYRGLGRGDPVVDAINFVKGHHKRGLVLLEKLNRLQLGFGGTTALSNGCVEPTGHRHEKRSPFASPSHA